MTRDTTSLWAKLAVFIGGFLLVGCAGRASPPPPTPDPTLDPCAPERVPDGAQAAHQLMREFDDTSFVAQQTPREQLADVILALQSTRRTAEGQAAPACLQTLKEAQLAFMNAVIISLTDFLGGAPPGQVQAQIAAARELRTAYDAELARLLGVTLVPTPTLPMPTVAAATPTPAATGTLAPPSSTPTPTLTATHTPIPAIVSVQERVNLRSGPGTNYELVGTLEAGQSAEAVARSADSQWVQIQVPGASGDQAWVFAPLVELSVPVEVLPEAGR